MRRLLIPIILITSSLSAAAHADTYTITMAASLFEGDGEDSGGGESGGGGLSGRLMVFFITEQGRRWDRRSPISGPFFSKPQPIASVAVEDFMPGASVIVETWEASFPDDLDTLDGPVRIQAILDIDQTMRSHADGPGNVFSEVVEVTLSRDEEDSISLVLSQRIEKRDPPPSTSMNLQWVEFRSELLSEFYGRDVHHRAGVAFPLPCFEKKFPQKDWPAIYVIPGYGGRHFGATDYAEMFTSRGIEEVAPMAVTIVLDPDSPLGHHGFVDSPNHGPRGTALVTELIPHLEEIYRLVSRPEARLVTGHSSGGWSSLWLQLQWPDVFGGCWSTAPDPIDFHAFQMTNVYEDANMYITRDGHETPSYRRVSGPGGQTSVVMTVRQEGLMEHAMHPKGGSGQQWDAWEAMFSPRDEETGYPRAMFDGKTGRIDRRVVEHWKKFDITDMVANDWEHYGPIVTNKVRLMCGTLDSFYLNRAVDRFKAMVMEKSQGDEGPGYIRLVEYADHGNLREKVFTDINEEMRAHLRKHDLHD